MMSLTHVSNIKWKWNGGQVDLEKYLIIKEKLSIKDYGTYCEIVYDIFFSIFLNTKQGSFLDFDVFFYLFTII